jgi:predicted flap endonuclease-1-like 5' DNA nuclease
MSSACTQMCLVSISRMEALAGELRHLQSGMADMQARLERVLGELAGELQQHAEQAAVPAPAAAMAQAAVSLQDADHGAAQAVPRAAAQTMDGVEPADGAQTIDGADQPNPAAPDDDAQTMESEKTNTFAAEPVARLPVVFGDQFKWIASIEDRAVEILHTRGITTFAGIAAMTARDVREIGALMGDGCIVAAQGWIEQAALLAHGIDAGYARKVMDAHDMVKVSAIAGLQGEIAVVTPAGDTAGSVAEPATQTAAPAIIDALPHNVIDLATRRKPRAPTARPIVTKAARWAATIVLTAMAAALTATEVGLASGIAPDSELPSAVGRGCTDMSPLCAIKPGIPW